MSNPNDECRKGKKVKEFHIGQEVYTIELTQGLDKFAFKRWAISSILDYLSTPYVLVRMPNGPALLDSSREFTLLCGDSIFATPQEASEEFYDKIKKICREIERAATLGPDGTWDEFIV